MAQGPPIKVGALMVMTGPFKDVTLMQAIDLAAERANAEGGLLVDGQRRKVEVVFADTKADEEVAPKVAKRLIEKERVAALIGPTWSGAAITIGKLADQARVPMITPTASSPEVSAGREYVFRTIYTDDFQGAVAAKFARDTLVKETAAAVYGGADAYSSGLARRFMTAFEGEGGRVVADVPYDSDSARERLAALKRVVRSRPDVLYLPAPSNDEITALVDRVRKLGFEGALLGADAWDLERLAKHPSFDGSYKVDLWSPQVATPSAQAFVKAFARASGKAPDSFAAASYDAMNLLFAGIEQGGSAEGAALNKSLHAIRRFEGATGLMLFDAKGDPRRSAVIIRIGRGSSAYLTSVKP